MSPAELNEKAGEIVVALMTATGQMRLDYLREVMDEHEFPEVMTLAGMVMGQFATVVEALREEPVIAPTVDRWLQRLAMPEADDDPTS